MSIESKNSYSADPHLAEVYDQFETQTEDVDLIRRLIGSEPARSIFEPFTGTGRIAIPLARDGHRVIALDDSRVMLDRLRQKLSDESQAVRDRIKIVHANVFAASWPDDQDVVLLGGNCFYEVSSSDEQRALVFRAAAALRPGGHVYIGHDNHPSDLLDESWRRPPGDTRPAYPRGECADGTRLEATTETAWYDVHGRFVHYKRRLNVTSPDGTVTQHLWESTCHPAIMADTLAWTEQAGLVVEQTFSDVHGMPYKPESSRAIVWARRD